MSAGTLRIEVKGDLSRFAAATRKVIKSMRGLRLEIDARTYRRDQGTKLAVARTARAFDPRVDIQVVTMSDGVCRVVVRQLGGWTDA